MSQPQLLSIPNELPFDVDDPQQAAVAWSGIIEPGDPAARLLIRAVGQKRALQWVFNPAPRDPQESADWKALDTQTRDAVDAVPWRKVHQRWHVRAASLSVSEYLEMGRRLGARVISPASPEWPGSLAVLEDREPLALWVRGAGDFGQLNAVAISLVGARASTSYGNRVAQTFAADLASVGYPVVSGGAYGIDTAAHRGALSAPEGSPRGLAILCGGVGNLYPAGNEPLFEKLMRGGLLVSEVPPNWRPARWRFLERNRVIAALGSVTVVVEAGIRSGAIATANRALELGRSVGAVPGPISSPVSGGCHQLLREGATLVTSTEDVLSLARGEEPDVLSVRAPTLSLTPLTRIVWSAFPTSRRATIDFLAAEAGLSPTEVQVALLEMQLRGLAQPAGEDWERIEVGL